MKNLTKVLNESASFVSGVTGDKNILTKTGFKNIIMDAQLTKEYIKKLTDFKICLFKYAICHTLMFTSGQRQNRTADPLFFRQVL